MQCAIVKLLSLGPSKSVPSCIPMSTKILKAKKGFITFGTILFFKKTKTNQFTSNPDGMHLFCKVFELRFKFSDTKNQQIQKFKVFENDAPFPTSSLLNKNMFCSP